MAVCTAVLLVVLALLSGQGIHGVEGESSGQGIHGVEGESSAC